MWGIYKNGNAIVRINLENGTKIRETDDDEFDIDFPETIDINCTNFCSGNCPFCYQGCSIYGEHGDLMGAKFIDTLRPYTEVALQVNDLTHPQLIPFLQKLREKRIIANITVNQMHFKDCETFISHLIDDDLIKGIGISLQNPTDDFIKRVQKYPNAVIHVINGILSASDIERLRDHNLKMLILGYKYLGRGVDYYNANELNIKAKQRYLYDVLPTLPEKFEVLSFDNLALEQLNVKRILPEEEWESFYMGDEGTSSMYIDLVKKKFGISSLCKPEEMHPILDNIDDMFKVVKNEAKNNGL